MGAIEDPEAEARAQYRGGAYNRRVAAEAENALRAGTATGRVEVELLCTCGRDDCDEIITMFLDEYDGVREKPYRFVVAPAHDDEIDEVIAREDEYWVVEVKAPFRRD